MTRETYANFVSFASIGYWIMSYQHDLAGILRHHQSGFYPVLPFDMGKENLCMLDFTENNKELTGELLNDTISFCRYIDEILQRRKARYGIGGYAEHRTIYSRSQLFDPAVPGEEPRRFHLGIDIWGKAGTPICAALDGSVHSVGFNNRPGDYGGTIILSHNLQGIGFYTLYGHLSLASVKKVKESDRIRKAEIIGWLGIPIENGHWPPHLHFQIIRDMQGYKGDYPGVCRISEKDKYLQNCPDPDLILQMNQYVRHSG